MRVHWHLAAGLAAVALTRKWSGGFEGAGRFLLANTAVDVDHFPGYALRAGIVNPAHYLQLGILGRIAWGPNRHLNVEALGKIPRPLHHPLVIGALWLVSRGVHGLAPVVAGMAFHSSCDFIDETLFDWMRGNRPSPWGKRFHRKRGASLS